MTPNLLILGGTTESAALAKALAGAGFKAVLSFAGRVAKPAEQPLPIRVGGFGGAQGLAAYIQENAVTHVVDATHPFAAQMSTNAVSACDQTGVPLIALTRPEWSAEQGDTWTRVPDIDAAVVALDRPAASVFLAVGRMHIAEFAAQPQHHYLLRFVDPPEGSLALPDSHVITARGPFRHDDDLALMRAQNVQVVVSKNAGGTGAVAKITAARALGLEVIMIDRPVVPARREVSTMEAVLDWLDHASTDRGV